MRQKRALRWQHTASYVRVAVDGNPTIEEFRPLLREIAADAVSWERPALLLDLRSLCKEWSLAEQFLFGGLMSRKLSQLKMVAVLQVAGQRLRAGAKPTGMAPTSARSTTSPKHSTGCSGWAVRLLRPARRLVSPTLATRRPCVAPPWIGQPLLFAAGALSTAQPLSTNLYSPAQRGTHVDRAFPQR